VHTGRYRVLAGPEQVLSLAENTSGSNLLCSVTIGLAP
jgi:hypothetical protein